MSQYKLSACLLALAAIGMAGHATAAPSELLPKRAGDLDSAIIAAPAASPQSMFPKMSREPVAMSWAVQEGAASPTPFLAQSRESYTAVTGAELAKGVSVHTTAPRALVRLQALADTSPRARQAIHPLSLTVVDGNGRAHAAGEAMEMLVTDEALAKADAPFAPGTSAFRLKQELGAGSFKLRADKLDANERYLVNVVEPDSPLTLTMQTGAAAYLHGQQLTVQSELLDRDGPKPALSRLDGYVVSPAGRRFPLAFKPEGGRMRAALALDADEAPAPGLWEVHAEGSSRVKGREVVRSLRLAFPVAMPVARLTRSVALADGQGGVNLKLGVEAAEAGRYEVRGVLYGTVKGELKPLGVAHAAQWMEAGGGSIALGFAPELRTGASGPYEIRELMLLDQARMGVLQRQQRALVVEEAELERISPRASHAAVAAPVQRVKRAPNAQAR